MFRMATKRKHNEVTLKTMYEEPTELEKNIPSKEVAIEFNFLEAHVLLGTKQSRPFSVEEIVSEFSEQPAEVITDGDDKNED